MVACYYKNPACVAVLLEHGATLHTRMAYSSAIPMPSGSNALHCAARGNNLHAATLILQALVCCLSAPACMHTMAFLF
jgi:ankyrin repeat protein